MALRYRPGAKSCGVFKTAWTTAPALRLRPLSRARNKAKTCGYTLQLVYIGLDTPERGILRVQERVLQGGHDVPDEDVRRRG